MGLKSLGAAIGGRLARQRASVKRRTQSNWRPAGRFWRARRAAAASALERALVIAIESAPPFARAGIVRDELASHLTKAGISQTDAEAAALSSSCDAIVSPVANRSNWPPRSTARSHSSTAFADVQRQRKDLKMTRHSRGRSP
jgi:hypothetical protein